ncbi:MAG: RimK-like protein, partial [Planctomycetia bacterium]
LQEEIVGTNVRVFVAGDRIAACEIATPHLDYRDDHHPMITATALPDDVARQCREIARTLELAWTGIDFRRDTAGRHVFLEANPSPMFLGFEERCGLPLTKMLVDLHLEVGGATRAP